LMVPLLAADPLWAGDDAGPAAAADEPGLAAALAGAAELCDGLRLLAGAADPQAAKQIARLLVSVAMSNDGFITACSFWRPS